MGPKEKKCISYSWFLRIEFRCEKLHNVDGISNILTERIVGDSIHEY